MSEIVFCPVAGCGTLMLPDAAWGHICPCEYDVLPEAHFKHKEETFLNSLSAEERALYQREIEVLDAMLKSGVVDGMFDPQ